MQLNVDFQPGVNLTNLKTICCPAMVVMVEMTMMIFGDDLMPTAESRSHWTIAMQVRRSPFKISENLSRLFTHLKIRIVD